MPSATKDCNHDATELGVLFKLQGDPCPELKTVYLPYPIPSTTKRQPQDSILTLPTISLSPWAQGLLPRGYTVSEVLHPTGQHPQDSSLLTLLVSNESFSIHIQYWHLKPSEPSPAMAIQARIWILESPPASSPDENGADTHTLHSNHQPHNSAIWFILRDSPIPLTPKNMYLQNNTLTLRLWLGPAAPSHCHTYVEIVPDFGSPPRDLFTHP